MKAYKMYSTQKTVRGMLKQKPLCFNVSLNSTQEVDSPAPNLQFAVMTEYSPHANLLRGSIPK